VAGSSPPALRDRMPVLVSVLIVVALVVVPFYLALRAKSAGNAARPPASLESILERIPAENPAAASRLGQDLVALGPKGVADLAAMIVEPGDGDDSRPRAALRAMAVYAGRPGGKADRAMFSRAAVALLSGPTAPAAKSFLLDQLPLVGGPEIVGPVANLLLDEDVGADAALLLVTIGGDAAAKELRHALAKAQGMQRPALIVGLGTMRDAAAVPLIRGAIADPQQEVRLAVYFALGSIGDASAADAILKAAVGDDAHERSMAADAALMLAQRLAEADKTDEAARIFRSLAKTRTAPQDRQVRCAAIVGLADLLGAGAMDDLAAAVQSDEAIREEAAAAAVKIADGLGPPDAEAVRSAMRKVIEVSKNEDTRKAAAEILRKVEKQPK